MSRCPAVDRLGAASWLLDSLEVGERGVEATGVVGDFGVDIVVDVVVVTILLR